MTTNFNNYLDYQCSFLLLFFGLGGDALPFLAGWRVVVDLPEHVLVRLVYLELLLEVLLRQSVRYLFLYLGL